MFDVVFLWIDCLIIFYYIPYNIPYLSQFLTFPTYHTF
jgi:hypothetical protein